MISFAADQRFPDSVIRNDRCWRKTDAAALIPALTTAEFRLYHILDVGRLKSSALGRGVYGMITLTKLA